MSTDSHSPPPHLYYPTAGRIIQVCLMYLCTAILGALIITRFEHHYKQFQPARIFALVIYWLTFGFIVIISIEGQLQDSFAACYMSYYMTLSFYAILKTTTLVVLVLRTRPLSKVPLWKDPVFLILMFLLLIPLGNVFYRSFMEVYAVDAEGDGKCILGIPFREAIFLLGFDVAWNIVLAFLFLWHLGRHTRNTSAQMRGFWPSLAAFQAVRPFGKIDQSFFTIEKQPEFLAAKALVAAGILTLSTCINLMIMVLKHGHEEVWLFLSTCTLDCE